MRTLEDQVPQRLFAGIPVPDSARDRIAAQLPASLPGRPVPKINWHFTLRFLGDTESSSRDAFVSALQAITLGTPFEIRFDVLGAFPDPRKARILWLGVDEGQKRITALAAKVESAARAAGFPPETREYTPHLTLARLRPSASITHLIATAKPVSAAMIVNEVVLYRSELGGGTHSRYEIIERFPLRRRESECLV